MPRARRTAKPSGSSSQLGAATGTGSGHSSARGRHHGHDGEADAPEKRSRARRGEGDRLRDEILDAAAQLLIETGDADKVSMRAVAQLVGCTSPALYLHFPDKASLLYCVCDRHFDQLSRQLADAVTGMDDPVERLSAILGTYVHFALDNPEQYRVMMLDDHPSNVFDSSLEELASTTGFDAVVSAVDDGIKEGLFAPTDPRQAALLLWMGVHGMVSLLLVKPALALPGVDDLVEMCMHHHLEGLRARTDAPAPRARRSAPSRPRP